MFNDRNDAGMHLAEKLREYENDSNAIIFAIPRGGVIIADIVCEQLNLPMDIVVTRKIGAPFNEELAIGAVGPAGEQFLNYQTIDMVGAKKEYIEKETRYKTKEACDRLKKYRGSDKYEVLSDKKLLLVDDGVATGYTVLAAINFLKGFKPDKLILGIPVIAPDTLTVIEEQVDELVYVISREPFYAVGQFYKDFSQVSDIDVMKVLNKRGFPLK